MQIFNRIKDFLFEGARKGASPSVRAAMKDYGEIPIIDAMVCREPLSSKLDKFINFITLGKFQEAKKNMHYDDLFHLYLLIRLKNEKVFRLEKNQIVEIKPQKSYGVPHIKGGECRSVHIPRDKVTINDLIIKGEELQGKEWFWRYNFDFANCQKFIKTILEANNLLYPELEKFIVQDVASIVKEIPSLFQKLGQKATDLAAKIDVLRHGKGKCSHCRKTHMRGGKPYRPCDEVIVTRLDSCKRGPQLHEFLKDVLKRHEKKHGIRKTQKLAQAFEKYFITEGCQDGCNRRHRSRSQSYYQ